MRNSLVSLRFIPDGDAGSFTTLALMRDLVRQDLRNLWAVRYARQLTGSVIATEAEKIEAIRDFFGRHFFFTPDPVPMDRIASPEFQLREFAGRGMILGDCAWAAVLAAFFGAVWGFGWHFEAVGFEGVRGPLTHVYTVLTGAAGTYNLDVTRNPRQVVPAATRAVVG